MDLPTQPYKGARDFYPEDKRLQKHIFAKWRKVVESWGYEEYDAPIIEPLDMYKAKTGQEIVSEQTYNFTDRGGREVTLRPEMTPSVSRMVAARRQELGYPLRWYSIPNVWRYERPQKGRLREHWQLNVDVFGLDGLSAELEVINIADQIMRSFGAKANQYQIKINSRKILDWLLSEYIGLNPPAVSKTLKLLDKKLKMPDKDFEIELRAIVGAKTSQLDSLFKITKSSDLPSGAPVDYLDNLLKQLKNNGIKSEWDITLVRGFDYYNDIVFEIYDANPENNRSIFGGGRYDGLVGIFGAEPISAVGFGLGEVTFTDFLATHKLLPTVRAATDVYAVIVGDVEKKAAEIIGKLRAGGINVASGQSTQKLDKQIKTALKNDIEHAVFIGAAEIKSAKYTLKNLQTTKESKLDLNDLILKLKESKNI